MITFWDKIVIGSVLVASLFVYLLFFGFLWGEQAEKVEVFVDGERYGVYNLAEISGTKKVEINTEYGQNTLEISNAGAKMVESSCPDKIDVHCGEISKPGQMIICIPNRVSVKISGKEDFNVDKVTY